VVDDELPLAHRGRRGSGVGKTRLALHIANLHAETFPAGVWFMDVSAASNPEQLLQIIARHVGCQFNAGASERDQLVAYLRPLQTLLVLDGFDRLIDEPDLVMDLLAEAPGLKVLLTSRERLNYQAACLFDLRGLPYPAELSDLNPLEYPAVQLFLSRAQRSRAGFTFSQENLENIIEICQLTDGNPLALELAASRLREFSYQTDCQQLAPRPKAAADLSARSARSQHRSMTAALEQSWKILSARRAGLLPASLAAGRPLFRSGAGQAGRR
jgi:predicted ATPase